MYPSPDSKQELLASTPTPRMSMTHSQAGGHHSGRLSSARRESPRVDTITSRMDSYRRESSRGDAPAASARADSFRRESSSRGVPPAARWSTARASGAGLRGEANEKGDVEQGTAGGFLPPLRKSRVSDRSGHWVDPDTRTAVRPVILGALSGE